MKTFDIYVEEIMKRHHKTDRKKIKSKLKRKVFEAISIGIWGAVIWSIVGYFVYWLNLAKISPAHISKGLIDTKLLFHWQGILLSLFILIGISILFSLIYVFLFSRIYTPWIGIILGGVIWYILLGWRRLDINTIASTISLFILYGAFVGYTLSVEFSSLEKKN